MLLEYYKFVSNNNDTIFNCCVRSSCEWRGYEVVIWTSIKI